MTIHNETKTRGARLKAVRMFRRPVRGMTFGPFSRSAVPILSSRGLVKQELRERDAVYFAVLGFRP